MKLADTAQAKILLVDDNPANLKVLFDYLVSLGFSVLVAPGGERAFLIVDEERPDIILLDVKMPDIDGFEVCRRLKEEESTRDIPVIFMTALTETDDKVQGFQLGGVDYITKPFQQEEVFARIQAHLTIRRLQQQLQQQNAQLKELNAYKDKFFSIIAHDLRSPFSALLGFTDILVEGLRSYSQSSLEEILLKLQESAQHLFKLLENLLAWSRLQRGFFDYMPHPFHVKAMVERNQTLLAFAIEQKGISCSSSIPEDLIVYADPNMVNTIIRNILSNSVKFTPKDGTIHISGRQHDRDVIIAVSDSGVGIPVEKQEQLFRIDTKYQRTGTAGEKGTGLGLILCKEMIEHNKGTISIESLPDQGSTFTINLPRYAEAGATTGTF